MKTNPDDKRKTKTLRHKMEFYQRFNEYVGTLAGLVTEWPAGTIVYLTGIDNKKYLGSGNMLLVQDSDDNYAWVARELLK